MFGCSIALGDIAGRPGLPSARRCARTEQALALADRHRGRVLRGTVDMHVGMAALTSSSATCRPPGRPDPESRFGEHAGLPQNAYRWRGDGAGL